MQTEINSVALLDSEKLITKNLETVQVDTCKMDCVIMFLLPAFTSRGSQHVPQGNQDLKKLHLIS